jgi:hypothetical protein
MKTAHYFAAWGEGESPRKPIAEDSFKHVRKAQPCANDERELEENQQSLENIVARRGVSTVFAGKIASTSFVDSASSFPRRGTHGS